MGVRTYDSAKVSVVYGANLISGFSDDSTVTVEFSTNLWASQTGTDGTRTRNLLNDDGGMVTITLQQSSPSNDVLTAMALNDKLTGNGAAPVLVRDAYGNTICSGDTAWVVKIPNAEFGKNLTNRVWQLEVAHLTVFLGGNQQAA